MSLLSILILETLKGVLGLRLRVVEKAKFLQEFTEFLSRSLDFESGLGPLASLLVPLLGDECFIDINEPGGNIKRTASTSHVSRFALSRFENLNQNPMLFDDGSGLIVPMRARDRVFGTLTLLWTRRNQKYKQEDLAFISDIARRAALALDNARLFSEVSRANRMKDEFLTTLSHELRTPMNVILGWLDVLREEKIDAETYQLALTTLTRNAKAQMGLIDDLLDISKFTNGKMTLSLGEHDLSSLVIEAIESVSLTASAKQIEIQLTSGAGPHTATIDSDRIRQVLWNLLSNAVKFTPPGGKISISVESDLESTKISIHDTGQGISSEFLPQVFDRFRQEDGTLTRSQGGLGVGLSIASQLIELHGGEITAHSPGRGHGATFKITLRRNGKISEKSRQELSISGQH